jgi:guanidinoacetate N-methyltransferase
MKYGKDQYDKDILIDKNNFQVMMEWEKPYMQAIIKNLNPKGDVLEIGFGMGFSATEIQMHDIESHTIIESSPEVLQKAYKWAGEQRHRVIIVEGSWQKALNDLGAYDSIFLDDSPHDDYTDKSTLRLCQFYNQIAKSHVNPGAKFSWYQDRNMPIFLDSNMDFICKEFIADIPDNADYIPEDTQGLYMPIITFRHGSNPNVLLFGIDFSGNVSRMP